MTGAQQSRLKTISEGAGVDFGDSLTRAEAPKRIDARRQQATRADDDA